MTTFTEILPATKSSPHTAIRWTPDLQLPPGYGVLRIDAKRCTCTYRVTPFATDWPGRAFHLAKDDAGGDHTEEAYDVFVHDHDEAHDRCTCKGFFYAGHCKHAAAARALVANGWDTLSLTNPEADVAPAPADCPF